MENNQLQQLYSFMEQHAGTVDAVISAIIKEKNVAGPEPGVCLDGQNAIWRSYTDDEIQQILEGDRKAVDKYATIYIGHLTGKSGQFRNLNDKEFKHFVQHVCPTLATIAVLERAGILKETYFDDEGDALDHYSTTHNFIQSFLPEQYREYKLIRFIPSEEDEKYTNLEAFASIEGQEVRCIAEDDLTLSVSAGFDLDSIGTNKKISKTEFALMQFMNGLRHYVCANPQVCEERRNFYRQLAAGNRDSEKDNHLIKIDNIVKSMYEEKTNQGNSL